MSYCWGQTTKQSPWTLRKTNIDHFKMGVQSDQLPQSFRDVIKLTRALTERFVWIDALCILQDSPDDWAREAASMARVYANSLCTVILPASDPNQPLFIDRDVSLTRPATLQLTTSDGGRSAVVRLHPVLPKWNRKFDLGIEGEDESGLQAKQPTRKRAWCLQEYELSCRTVIFTTHQFVWLCREMQCSEEEFSDMSRPFVAVDNNCSSTGRKLASTNIEQLLWWPFGLR